jgi:hypothetical protein
MSGSEETVRAETMSTLCAKHAKLRREMVWLFPAIRSVMEGQEMVKCSERFRKTGGTSREAWNECRSSWKETAKRVSASGFGTIKSTGSLSA